MGHVGEKCQGWLIGYVKRKMHERAAKKKEETAADKAARITTTATVWMAIFTCVLALITGGTLIILKNQLTEMREGGVDTHNLAEMDQRAWIGPVKVRAPELTDASNHYVYVVPGSKLDFTAEVTNFGKSPGWMTEVSYRAGMAPSDREMVPDYRGEDTIGKSASIIWPQQPAQTLRTNQGTIVLSATDIEAIKLGSLRVFFIGEIKYTDIFKKPHTTTFCYQMNPTLDAFFACDKYNDAD